MAYHDALFQLGMDLTRSSTAQKEELDQGGRLAPKTGPTRRTRLDPQSYTLPKQGVGVSRQHLMIDLSGAHRLDDLPHVERTLRRCIEEAGETLVDVHLHQPVPGGGVTGVVVLAGSHISFHSWPESGYAALDVFLTADAQAHRTLPLLQEAFAAEEVTVKELRRGAQAQATRWTPADKKPVTRMRKARAA